MLSELVQVIEEYQCGNTGNKHSGQDGVSGEETEDADCEWIGGEKLDGLLRHVSSATEIFEVFVGEIAAFSDQQPPLGIPVGPHLQQGSLRSVILQIVDAVDG